MKKLIILGHRLLVVILLVMISLPCGGCDRLLKFLQKEMTEERELFGVTYRYNSKVNELQRILKDVGYNPGHIDGKMGRKTRSAIKAFQKDKGLKVSSYVDKKTLEKLHEVYNGKFFSFEKIGIKQIQTALKSAGFNPGSIDGKLGPRTKRALREFQNSKGLTQDGEIDFKTGKELKKYLLGNHSNK